MSADPEATEWTRRKGRGSTALMRLMVWIALRLGRGPARVVLHGISGYFLVFSLQGRRASRKYLRRALGREPTLGDRYRHIFTFASTLLDRVYLMAGREDVLTVEVSGREHLPEGGCLVMGAHLGSFDVLRTMATRHEHVPLRVLMHLRPDSKIERIYEELDPRLKELVIPVGEATSLLKARDAVRDGFKVGLLADRLLPGDTPLRCRFFGEDISLPLGPFWLAARLEVPVVLCFGLHVGWGHYHAILEPFAERLPSPERDLSEALQPHAQRFAERLEAHCREAPYNWFNFYDVWS